MPRRSFHVLPDDNFDDWIVRDDGGRELGHFPTRETAESIAEAIAREHTDDVVVHLPDGRKDRKTVARGWVARLLDR